MWHKQVQVIDWLVEQGCTLTEEHAYNAARYANAATVACLLDRDCPYDEGALIENACMNFDEEDVLFVLMVMKRMKLDVERMRVVHRSTRAIS